MEFEPRSAQLQSTCSFPHTRLPCKRTSSALVFGPAYTGEPKSEIFILGSAQHTPVAKLTSTAKKAHNLSGALPPCLAVTQLGLGPSHVQEGDRHSEHSCQLRSSPSALQTQQQWRRAHISLEENILRTQTTAPNAQSKRAGGVPHLHKRDNLSERKNLATWPGQFSA